ncbi:MAG TPA: fructose-bisphosphate aldolase, partial [Candidatus Atribacteria bacterium]|nr:fructose-bisphosphate aldolase [Candidatus Atribacteria bacterium]
VNSAGRTGVLISGGSKISDEDLLRKVKISLEAGVDGLIFGRNMWQRPYDEALRMTKEIMALMKSFD